MSIHSDSAPNRSASGFTAYVARAPSKESVHAAKLVLQKLTRVGSKSRGVKYANWRVLVNTAMPAVLVELGYLSNRIEAVKLADDAYQDAQAEALAEAIGQFFQPS